MHSAVVVEQPLSSPVSDELLLHTMVPATESFFCAMFLAKLDGEKPVLLKVLFVRFSSFALKEFVCLQKISPSINALASTEMICSAGTTRCCCFKMQADVTSLVLVAVLTLVLFLT